MTTYSLDVELGRTMHVRTPEGAARYGRPIGSVIERGGKKKKVEHLVSGAGDYGGGGKLFQAPPEPIYHEAPAKLLESPKPRRASHAEHHARAKKAAPKSGGDQATQNLYQLSPDRMQQAIDDPRTPKDRATAMKAIQAQRKTAAAKVLGTKPALKDYAEKNSDELENNPNKFFAGLYKICPALKPHMEALRKGKTGKTVGTTKKKGMDRLIDVAMELTVKAILTGVALHFGFGVGGGG